jgi:hypothetical protein
MKKNKTLGLILAIALLMGGTFIGTKAWFTNQASTDNSIKLTLGTVDLKIYENPTKDIAGNVLEEKEGWILCKGSDEVANGKEFSEFGKEYSLKRTFTIKNTGLLDQIVTISGEDKILEEEAFGRDIFDRGFLLEILVNDVKLGDKKEFELGVGEEKTVTLMIGIDYKALEGIEPGEYQLFTDILGNLELTGRQK